VAVTTGFLKDLGKLIEKEWVAQQKRWLKKLADKKKEIQTKQSSTKWWTKETTDMELRTFSLLNESKIKLQYTINSKEEDLSFSSMDELLKTTVFPKRIDSMIFRVTTYEQNDVEIYVRLRRGGNSVSLSSSDQPQLLMLEKELKNLFQKHKTGYAWIRYNDFLADVVAPSFVSLCVVWIGARILKHYRPNLDPVIFPLGVAFCGIVFLCLVGVMRWVYPSVSFEIHERPSLAKRLRITLAALGGALLVSVIVDVILRFI